MAQFTNTAQLSYRGGVVNSNVAQGEILEVYSAVKTAIRPLYTRGGDVTYAISIVNAGSTPLTGLTVTDNLGAYTFGTGTRYPLSYADGSIRLYVNGVLQSPAPTVTAGPPLVVSGLNIPADGNAVLLYEANVTPFAPLAQGATIVNTATVSGEGFTAITASETVTPEARPDLTISKAVDPVPVTENGRLTYTFLIQNYGNTAASADDNVIVTDTFDPVLSDLTVTLNGTVLTAGTQYTYTGGNFATAAGAITVPAATFAQDADGAWVISPGTAILTVTGTV